jgi:hypothetical protein
MGVYIVIGILILADSAKNSPPRGSVIGGKPQTSSTKH